MRSIGEATLPVKSKPPELLLERGVRVPWSANPERGGIQSGSADDARHGAGRGSAAANSASEDPPEAGGFEPAGPRMPPVAALSPVSPAEVSGTEDQRSAELHEGSLAIAATIAETLEESGPASAGMERENSQSLGDLRENSQSSGDLGMRAVESSCGSLPRVPRSWEPPEAFLRQHSDKGSGQPESDSSQDAEAVRRVASSPELGRAAGFSVFGELMLPRRRHSDIVPTSQSSGRPPPRSAGEAGLLCPRPKKGSLYETFRTAPRLDARESGNGGASGAAQQDGLPSFGPRISAEELGPSSQGARSQGDGSSQTPTGSRKRNGSTGGTASPQRLAMASCVGSSEDWQQLASLGEATGTLDLTSSDGAVGNQVAQATIGSPLLDAVPALPAIGKLKAAVAAELPGESQAKTEENSSSGQDGPVFSVVLPAQHSMDSTLHNAARHDRAHEPDSADTWSIWCCRCSRLKLM
eukprot:s1040_g4.t1